MKLRTILLLCTLLVSLVGNSQKFFKRLPKPVATQHRAPVKVSDSGVIITVPTAAPTMNAVRPIANIAAYSEPGHILMAGAGVAYEHLQWDAQTERWRALYSVSAVVFGGQGINADDPDKPAPVTYGLLAGFLNNLVNIGPVYNFGTKKVGVAVAIGINLN